MSTIIVQSKFPFSPSNIIRIPVGGKMLLLDAVIQQVHTKNFEIILLVHPEPHRLESVQVEVQNACQLPEIVLGSELSNALLSVERSERSREIPKWFANRVSAIAPGPILCTGIDLLFDPSFSLNPLAMLRQSARRAPMVVLWPGEFANDVLSYAVPTHRHYRTWSASGVTICPIS